MSDPRQIEPAPPSARSLAPEISLIMPCFNEQDVIPYTIPQLVGAFEQAGHRLELVACDNGSTDRTGEIIRRFVAEGLPVLHHSVERNEGYGNGILQSIPRCSAPWVGVIPADGQVDPEDAARLFTIVKPTDGMVLGKVRRRFRMDGLTRKVVSVFYNAFVWLLWPRLGSIDVNGTPKILHRDVLAAMDLRSKNWFLDPEMMIKAHYLGVRVLEMNVFARMRSNGLSHVRASACLEFCVNLLRFRFGGALTEWRRSRPQVVLRPHGQVLEDPH
ncbi:MAG TPA: glycosyltransferase family 2 protein [Vicinamibacterales bacterium]|nr:glycosyltransferase family 2 protein [Vicinamibacterales bacterium]